MHQDYSYDLDSTTTTAPTNNTFELTYSKLFKSALAIGAGFACAEVCREAVYWAGRKTGLSKPADPADPEAPKQ